MKNLITLLIVLFSLNGFTQKIDYTNFDNDLATKALAEAFLNFRDTIDCYGGGKKWNVTHPVVDSFPEMNKPRWSDWVYENISLPNCVEMSNNAKNVLYHVDRTDWYKGNEQLVRDVYYEGVPNVPQIIVRNARLRYSENIFMYTGEKETYQELATHMIVLWENSTHHRNAQRGLLYDTFSYKEYGLKIQDLFACCVIYNPYTKTTRSSINFIE